MIQTLLLSSPAPPAEGVMGPTGQARAPDGWDAMFAEALKNFMLAEDGENQEELAGAAGVFVPGMPVPVDTAFPVIDTPPVIETSGEAAASAVLVAGTPPEATHAAPGFVPPAGGESPVNAAVDPAASEGQVVGNPADALPVGESGEQPAPVLDASAAEPTVQPPAQAKSGPPAETALEQPSARFTQPVGAGQASEQVAESPVKEASSPPAAKTAEPAPPAEVDLPAESPAVQGEAVVEPAAPAGVQPSQFEAPLTSRPAVQAVDASDQAVMMQMVSSIQSSVQQGQSSLRLQLQPQELGSIDVRLVSSSQGVAVTVFADQASTGRLLEMQIDQLRAALQDAGVQVSHLNVFQQNQPHHEAPPEWNRKLYGRRQPAFAPQEGAVVDAVEGVRLEHSMVDYRV